MAKDPEQLIWEAIGDKFADYLDSNSMLTSEGIRVLALLAHEDRRFLDELERLGHKVFEDSMCCGVCGCRFPPEFVDEQEVCDLCRP